MIRAAHGGVKRIAQGLDAVRPPEPGIVILAYHRVGARTALEIDLDPAMFADQMAYLAESSRPVSLDTAVAELVESEGVPGTAVTFDDGTADFMDHALPALVATGVPATYYIATEFIEQERPFPNQGTPLSWAALSEAVSTGLVTVGSHTHSHAVMDKVDPVRAEAELTRSIALIEDRLGTPVAHFAYPKGVAGGVEVGRVVAAHVRSAALADGAVNEFGRTDPLRLDRTPIQRSDGSRYFEAKVAGGLRLEGQLRRLLNGRRYRTAMN